MPDPARPPAPDAVGWLARGSESERWLAVLLRSLHLVAVAWLGAVVMGAPLDPRPPASLVLASGAVMLFMDLRAGRMALAEVAGAAVLVKLGLVAWMALDGRHAAWVFWLLVVGSAITSHAPKHFRHWPSRARPRSRPPAP